MTWRKGVDGEAVRREESLLAQAVLRRVQHRAGGADGRELGGRLDRGGGHVLELEGDDGDAARELAHGVEVVVSVLDLQSATWPVGVSQSGEKRVDAVAHPPRGDGEHAAELAAAEHADGGAGEDRGGVG